ncbi:MAG: hypothetical protein GF364_17590, partial [Candidatus Lokiarchaeota archaeon]|nr:hypothetical protein [Candidatus Lokiarchaeota archaeon]
MDMDKICVATWSVRNALKDKNIGYKGVIAFLLENNIRHIEINTMFLKHDASGIGAPLYVKLVSLLYPQKPLNDIIKILQSKNVNPLTLSVEGSNLFQKTQKGRDKQVKFVKSWIDQALNVGFSYIRVDLGMKIPVLTRNKVPT